MRKITKQMIAFLMTLVMLSGSLTGCKKEAVTPQTDAITSIVEEALKDALVSGDVKAETEKNTGQNQDNSIEQEGVEVLPSLSDEDRQNNTEAAIEAFVYQTMADELSLYYDVFSGSIVLPDGEETLGIVYTDYATLYRDEETGQNYFPCGFIPFQGERALTEEEISAGLVVEEYSSDENEWNYVVQYIRKPFQTHCVVYNHYIKYGIDESGELVYTAEEFDKDTDKEKVDESLGSLYSYDDELFLLDMEGIGDYTSITGTSLSEFVDFSSLSEEVNRILVEQNYNFSEVELQTYVYLAQEAMNSYLLSLEEESFLGHNVDELLEMMKEQNSESAFSYDENGLPYIELTCVPPSDARGLVQWLTTLMAGVSMIVNTVFENAELPVAADVNNNVLVCSISNIAIVAALAPYAPIIFNAVMQVILTIVNEAKEGFDGYTWIKVIISAVLGACVGCITKGVAYLVPVGRVAIRNAIDAAMDALIEATLVHIEDGQWSKFGSTFVLNFFMGLILGKILEGILSWAKAAKPMLNMTVKYIKKTLEISGRKLKKAVEMSDGFLSLFTMDSIRDIFVHSRIEAAAWITFGVDGSDTLQGVSDIDNSVKDIIDNSYNNIADSIVDSIDRKFDDYVDGTTNSYVDGTVKDTVDDYVDGTVKDTVDDYVDGTVKDTVDDYVDGTVKDTVDDYVDGTVNDVVDDAVIDVSRSKIDNFFKDFDEFDDFLLERYGDSKTYDAIKEALEDYRLHNWETRSNPGKVNKIGLKYGNVEKYFPEYYKKGDGAWEEIKYKEYDIIMTDNVWERERWRFVLGFDQEGNLISAYYTEHYNGLKVDITELLRKDGMIGTKVGDYETEDMYENMLIWLGNDIWFTNLYSSLG